MTTALDHLRDDGPLFHRRTAAVLMSIGVVAFIAFLVLRDIEPDLKAWRSVGPDGFSRSAIGYGALVETLERLGTSVRLARFRPVRGTNPEDVLILAMPPGGGAAADAVGAWSADAASAATLVLVLPKWFGERAAANPRWIGFMTPLPVAAVARVLAAAPTAAPVASVLRTDEPLRWRGAQPAGIPDLGAAQLIRNHGMTPLLGADQGDLIVRGTFDGRTVIVVSDPDLFTNMGLGNGANAAVATTFLSALPAPGGTLVFDETLHGLEREPSLWRLLLSPRFLPAALGGLLATMAMAWMASGRFGAPGPRALPAQAGKRALIEGGAGLLLQCGHGGAALAAYAAELRRDVERRLHVPAGEPPERRDDRLRRTAARRAVTIDGPALLQAAGHAATRRTSDSAVVALAADLHRWRREMLDGR